MFTTYICSNCHDIIPATIALAQDTKQKGARRYICPKCAKLNSTSKRNTSKAHGEKLHGFTIQFKLQGNPIGSIGHNSMINDVYNFIPQKTSGGAVQYDSPTYKSGNGLKKAFRSFTDFVDFTGDCTITVGHRELNAENMQNIREHAAAIFAPLTEYMDAHNPEMLEIFGGEFDRNHRRGDFTHKGAFCLKTDTIAFRLAKFNNPNQYYQLSELCREIIETINTNFLQHIGKGKEAHKANVTGGKLVAVFEKYASGAAHCQLARRNSKKA